MMMMMMTGDGVGDRDWTEVHGWKKMNTGGKKNDERDENEVATGKEERI